MAMKPCIDCGHEISEHAGKCPTCRSDAPHGVRCFMCEPVGGVPFPKKDAVMEWNQIYHRDCIKRMMTVPAGTVCRECKTPLSVGWEWKELYSSRGQTCKNCGIYDVFSRIEAHGFSCGFCHLSIFSFHEWAVYRTAAGEDKMFHASCLQIFISEETKRRLAAQRNVQTKSTGCMSVVIIMVVLFGILVFFR